jgi:DivIVA domain-containing protein
MEVTAKTLREVEFREKMRGYHPEDVDHFLEQVAAGIDVLHDRLRQAVERAQRAETAAAEQGGADDTLRKTLVLAQRTADLAVQEAREQASRILASAEQQAQALIAEAEERGRRAHEDLIAEGQAELSRLDTARYNSQQEVETLERWLDEHKAHLQASLSEALAAVERAGVLWPAPPRAADPLSAAPRRPAVSAPAEAAEAPAPRPEAAEPETMLWSPTEEEQSKLYDPRSPAVDLTARAEPLNGGYEADPDDRAMDEFFDESDESDEFGDDRRFGGRLRRRR